MTDDFGAVLGGARVMAILRGMGPERTLAVARRAWELGLTAVEVPIQSASDVEALAAVVEAGRPEGRLVGAGTVISAEHVRQAVEAGAAFTVSPGLDLSVVRASQDAGLPSLPGVATPSEVQQAVAGGLTWLKAFPATALGTGWFRAIRGPFPQVRLVATGGMDAHNAADFLAAGVRCVAVGSALEDDAQLPLLAELAAR